jgi:hypothetical protein
VEAIGLGVLFGAGSKCTLVLSTSSMDKVCSPVGSPPDALSFVTPVTAQERQVLAQATVQRSIAPAGAVGISFILAGAASMAAGIAMLTGWGGTESLELRLPGQPPKGTAESGASAVRVGVTPFGLAGSF